jgi:hypothetical protein
MSFVDNLKLFAKLRKLSFVRKVDHRLHVIRRLPSGRNSLKDERGRKRNKNRKMMSAKRSYGNLV